MALVNAGLRQACAGNREFKHLRCVLSIWAWGVTAWGAVVAGFGHVDVNAEVSQDLGGKRCPLLLCCIFDGFFKPLYFIFFFFVRTPRGIQHGRICLSRMSSWLPQAWKQNPKLSWVCFVQTLLIFNRRSGSLPLPRPLSLITQRKGRDQTVVEVNNLMLMIRATALSTSESPIIGRRVP